MLTRTQIRVLNTARTVLAAIRVKTSPESQQPYANGVLAEACHAAEDAIFNVMNVASSHKITDIHDDDLFMRETDGSPDEDTVGTNGR